METTGTAIMKKLSGEAAAGVGTGVRIAKAFEDMHKEGEQAQEQATGNKDIEMQAEANKITMEKVEAMKHQQNNFQNRITEIRGGNE